MSSRRLRSGENGLFRSELHGWRSAASGELLGRGGSVRVGADHFVQRLRLRRHHVRQRMYRLSDRRRRLRLDALLPRHVVCPKEGERTGVYWRDIRL